MEQRKRNIMINKVGGSSPDTTLNYKIALPAPWMKEMEITKEDREVIITFENGKITIEKATNTNQP